ncbi:unnamed protein product [Triticum turgidum subsp. durum]|uniref:UspA domain-containing protein n=1 Tax=Triticum turgidum subsp. durum TaxID=4567 RepID=A0A9R1S6N0_TRITD|nr:unnamed protein product [Triticum turgidum subsp. durum]
MASGSGEHFLRQLSSSNGLQAAQDGYGGGGGRRRGSRRWSKKRAGRGSGAKHAMMWALTHVANRGDFLTLLHILPHYGAGAEEAPSLANSLGTLCKACRPEVEVEALVIQGPKLGTILSQVKKLEASVLVLSQTKPSTFCWLSCLTRSSGEELVEQCINQAECLTLAVRKQSKGVGGYLVSTRWQKNFWLLA